MDLTATAPDPPTSPLRTLARRALPHPLRVELLRLARLPRLLLESRGFARRPPRGAGAAAFPVVLAAHASPLRRAAVASARLQRGKEANVARAARLLDGVVLGPCQTFSYHAVVGRPSRLRGFRRGLELHDGRPSAGVGGGCCQVSNLLYLLALRGGLRIVERHRHALDLFPDRDRQVPFGCGATVFYNLADLRFENPLPGPVQLRLRVAGGELRGELRAAADPGFQVEIYEVDHRFARTAAGWERENRVRRRLRRADGTLLLDEEVAHNRARVLYDPEETAPCGAPA